MEQKGLSPSRAVFVSRLGGLLAAAGSAIGLGNIWRFPTQVGLNGGSAFLVVYLVIILLFGIPMLMCEFVIGRRSRVNVARSYGALSSRRWWNVVGYGSSLVAYAIFCYYAVIVGWVLYYFWSSLTGSLSDLMVQATAESKAYENYFTGFISHPWMPILFLAVTMGIIHFIIVAGVEKGIERCSKLLVPALFVIMMMLAVAAAFMPGAAAGYSFLFDFRISEVNSDVCLSALGQCFYSFSIGMGLVTYASYFTRDTNLTRAAVSVSFLDTFVAILAGLIIFPAVFSVAGASPAEGAGMVFISLPAVFNSAFGASPVLSWIIPVAFYFILFVAAVTSAMFLYEVATAFISEKMGLSRKKTAALVSGSAFVIGAVSSLSMGPLSDVLKIGGMNLIDFIDMITSNYVLPLTGLGAALFVGWQMKSEEVLDELSSGGMFKVAMFSTFRVLVRYLLPLLILGILIRNII